MNLAASRIRVCPATGFADKAEPARLAMILCLVTTKIICPHWNPLEALCRIKISPAVAESTYSSRHKHLKYQIRGKEMIVWHDHCLFSSSVKAILTISCHKRYAEAKEIMPWLATIQGGAPKPLSDTRPTTWAADETYGRDSWLPCKVSLSLSAQSFFFWDLIRRENY